MVITQAIRNCTSKQIVKHTDYLYIEWYQAAKRIQRLTTADGMEIGIRFLEKGQQLKEGDVLYEDEQKVVMVSILPCEVIVVTSNDVITIGTLALEIGNKHIPLFVQGNSLCLPYERAMYDWLCKHGYMAEITQRQLCSPLNANVDFEQHKKFSFTLPKGSLSLKI